MLINLDKDDPTRARQAANAPASANGLGTVKRSPAFEELRGQLSERVREMIDPSLRNRLSRGEIARIIGEIVGAHLSEAGTQLNLLEHRDLITILLNEWGGAPNALDNLQQPNGDNGGGAATGGDGQAVERPAGPVAEVSKPTVESARSRIQPLIMERIDVAAASKLSRSDLERQIADLIPEILLETRIQLNHGEQREVITKLLDDMLGLGPLEPLLADEAITDIMVNGYKQVYIERRGKLELSEVKFRDNGHVMNIATRIVSRIGRRIDEASPLCDARLMDGSRVNIIIPPLAIDGASISIRKFSKKSITIDRMMQTGNISSSMGTVLKIAGRARVNILISGGTGSGKTTLLNALSHMIDPGERVVTIEDAAELQLQQPHVVRLETRPPNIEGKGEVSMRDLVKNALRMRPDRIILGEVRAGEALDMLQAMNTGHEGSMGTVHANRPREALTRLENMIGMAGVNMPSKAVRQQISAAINMIVQIARMRDGMRRVISITEIVGMEGDVITTQELFSFHYEGEGPDGKIRGVYKSSGLRPAFLPRAEYYGLDRALLEAL